jgi:DNA-binding beta-propeller fold protein YncE
MSFARLTLTRVRSHHVTAIFASALAIALAGCQNIPPSAPERIGIDARPNGIAAGKNGAAIFVTDDRGNAVLWSHDRATFSTYMTVPTVAGQPNSLGQIVVTTSGELLVARFGFGESGALFISTSTGDAQLLTGLAPERRRLGLASVGPARVLSSWFVKEKDAPLKGGVSLVSYDPVTHAANERDLIVGFAKPVGVAVQGDVLLVADQDRNTVLRYSLTALLAARTPATADSGSVFARIDHPDLLAIDNSGTAYTKCGATAFCRLAPDGTATPIANDFQDARGVTIDEATHSIYVVDRAKTSAASGSAIRIFPLVASPATAR